MNLGVNGIIAKGLGCGTAGKGLIITTHFSLYCGEPAAITGSGGGPYPHEAWNKVNSAQDFYQQVPPEQQPYYVPLEDEAKYFESRKIITLKFKIKDFEIEKEFSVSEKRANVIISISNLINSTKSRINMSIKNIKRTFNQIKVIVKNIHIKKD